MSGLDLLKENLRDTPRAPYLPKSFGELQAMNIYAESLRATKGMANIFGQIEEEKAFLDRTSLFQKRFGTNDVFSIIDTRDIDAKYPNATGEAKKQMLVEKHAALDKYIEENRGKDQRLLGIKTKKEIESDLIEKTRFAIERSAEETVRNGTWSGQAAAFTGGLFGAFTDVVNLSTLPLGFGNSMGIIKTMAMEGSLNMAIEGTQIPDRKEWMDKLGYKYGLKEAAADIAMAGGGAAILSGIVRGASKGIEAFRASKATKSSEMLDAASKAAGIKSEQRDALKYQSRIDHLDEGNPVVNGGIDSVAEHRKNLDETQAAFREQRAPEISIPKAEAPEIISIKKDLSDIRRFLKTGKVPDHIGTEKLMKRPLIKWLRDRGGVKVGSFLDGELRHMGITNQTAPGLFKKAGGLGDIDNIPRDEFEAQFGAAKDDGTGHYVDRDFLLEKIREENIGNKTSAHDYASYVENAKNALDEAGYDINKITPEEYQSISGNGFEIKLMADERKLDISLDELSEAKRATVERGLSISEAVDELAAKRAASEEVPLSAYEDEIGGYADADPDPKFETIDEFKTQIDELEEMDESIDELFQSMAREDMESIMTITDLDGNVIEGNASDILDMVKENEAIMTAVKTCGIG
jgi:hypothetical protein